MLRLSLTINYMSWLTYLLPQIIERILEFTRHQIMDIMCACDPSYRALHRPNENIEFEGRVIEFYL